jgi:hypothetical protein
MSVEHGGGHRAAQRQPLEGVRPRANGIFSHIDAKTTLCRAFGLPIPVLEGR